MARGSSLSDDKVIAKVNQDFVAIEVNLTDTGFPKDVPALAPWEKAFESDWKFEYGFATSVVIGPGAKGAFGTSGCGHTQEWDTSISYHADKYAKFLDESLDRFRRAEAILKDTTKSAEQKLSDMTAMKEEIQKAITEAAKCKKSKAGTGGK